MRASLASLVLFALGVGLSLVFLTHMAPAAALPLAIVALVGLRALAGRPAAAAGTRRSIAVIVRGAARLALLAFHVFALYLAVAWGGVLAWTTPWWARIAVAALLLGWAYGLSGRAVRIPLILPLGVWIAVCLAGWLREESVVRCDDYRRLQPPASLLVATTDGVPRCRPGDRVPIGRYPRKFWQSPNGRWLRFTTQSGSGDWRRPSVFDGLVCELDLARRPVPPPRCVGGVEGKSHGIAGSDALGEMFAAAYGLPPDGEGRTSAIFVAREDGPLVVEAEHRFDGSVGDIIVEPKSGTLHAFCDGNDRVRSVTLPSFARRPDTIAAIFPGEIRYDPARDEGVVCSWLTGAAVRANPLSWRFFGVQRPTLWSVSAISWGCDWDPATRRVYTAVPNLGALYEVDYDSGQILHRYWVGFGMRSATLDRRRGVVYLTDFLGGHVVAVDVHTGAERARWFVGRFVREAYVARDGRSLFVSSNLGVVQIGLGEIPDPAPSPAPDGRS